MSDLTVETRVWVCTACGRTSDTRDDFKDASCMLNAVLCYGRQIDGQWVAVRPSESLKLVTCKEQDGH